MSDTRFSLKCFQPDSVHLRNECVILLHGLARTSRSMDKLSRALAKEGYLAINAAYPSRSYPVEVLATKAIELALEACCSDHKVNFVTHSLGGILVRQYLHQKLIHHLNRVVMLGPPNAGSEVVDRLKNIPGFLLLNGVAGMSLGTEPSSLPGRLGAANFDVGIIAGNRSINWLLSMLISGDNDGKVSVERTRLEKMQDHIVVPVSHPFLMKNEGVIHQVIHYLTTGRFDDNHR